MNASAWTVAGPMGQAAVALWLVLVAAVVVAWAPRRPSRQRRRRPILVRTGSRSRAPAPLDVAHLIERLATVIASGVDPRSAWSAVELAQPDSPLARLARGASQGADLMASAPAALRRSPQLRALSAALGLCARTGAPTAQILHRLADGLRDVADADLARRSALAGPLATARLLAALPVAGLALGTLLGADPIRTLTHGAGVLLGLAGALLTALGWWWMLRLVRAADPGRGEGVDASIILDLLAGPLAAGAPLTDALREVAGALDGEPVAPALHRAGTAIGRGTPAAIALSGLDDTWSALRETAVIGEATGADMVALLRGAATDSRRRRARDAEAAAARLAVRLVLPTGIALLPAFVLLGIIPTVTSLLGGSFGEAFGS